MLEKISDGNELVYEFTANGVDSTVITAQEDAGLPGQGGSGELRW